MANRVRDLLMFGECVLITEKASRSLEYAFRALQSVWEACIAMESVL